MTDLILCAAIINDEETLRKTIKSMEVHKFRKKFLLFDGPPDSLLKTDYDRYRKYKESIIKDYPEVEVTEYPENIYYKPMLDQFIRKNYDDITDELLILQDDVLVDDFDLEEVLVKKDEIENCKILYFRENRLRCSHWFNVIDDSLEDVVKTHGWSERVWITNKKDILEIFDNLPSRGGKNGKFIDVYYYNLMARGSWKTLSEEVKEEHWLKWGTYEHKTIRHKHLVAKRSKR